MCGVAGYIGESKHPEITWQLIDKLFENLEVRGKDAAGFWGTQAKNGQTLYHKEPGRPSGFVKKQIWRDVEKLNPNLLMVHAREASQGVGSPSSNRNNHPFVSNDLNIGMIHNGRIPQNVYEELIKKYEVRSNTDSELFLRIFQGYNAYQPDEINAEFANETKLASRLMGLRDIWATVFRAHMAVGIGERLDMSRRLWLFRNDYRSLWVVDAREQLGQIFFVSTPEIWQSAINDAPAARQLFSKTKVPKYDLPPEEVWCFEIADDCPQVTSDTFHKFTVVQSGEFDPWTPNGIIKADNIVLGENIYTDLNEHEELKVSIPQNNQGTEMCWELRNHITDIERALIRNEADLPCVTGVTDRIRKALNLLKDAKRMICQ